jgi:hypothetical protein
LPGPLEAPVERLGLWVQVATGQELDEAGNNVILKAATWQARRQRLEELGGPPLVFQARR